MADNIGQPNTNTLDEALQGLSLDEKDYLKSQIGIQNDDEFKVHISTAQKKALEVYPYRCIQNFVFLKTVLSRSPAYAQVIQLGKEREGALLLDIGCGLGNETRKLVADGFPMENIIASDLRPDLWAVGHELFRSTPETFPVTFLTGDVFDSSHLASDLDPFYEPPNTQVPVLSDLKSLIPLRGHLSVIHAGLFFHLFDEEHQLQLARAVASLLSPLPGSIIVGGNLGLPNAGTYEAKHRTIFCHSPESWRDLWDGVIFKKGTVKVNAGLIRLPSTHALGGDPNTTPRYMYWSVTRISAS